MPTSTPTHLRSSSSSSMAAVAIDVNHHPHFKPWKHRCRLRSFPQPDPTLLDLPSLQKFHRSISTPCFSTSAADRPAADAAAVEILGSRHKRGIHSLVVEAAIALAGGAVPVPASSGLGGAFFLRTPRSGECFAVLKPIDPSSLPLGSRLSVQPGESGFREVAAYLLDHGGFSGVPPTALIKISHPALHSARRIASIQRFVPHDFDAGDLGPSRFSVASVHRIGILDVRLLNIDRHTGNLLVRKQPVPNINKLAELVPIDHGLCLPELLDDPYFEWLHWPQSSVPFSDTETDYVAALDPFKDAEVLRSEIPSLRESAVRILILCTVFLKSAVASGICLAEIGSMMTRDFCGREEGPSALESICKEAEGLITAATLSEDDDSGGSSDRETGGSTEEAKDFQFEMECDGEGISEVLDIPIFLRSKMNEDIEEEEEDEDEEKAGTFKLGSITKSKSMAAADFSSYESGGAGSGGSSKCISFKWMSDEEWRLFLEKFEQLLPEAFEAREKMGLKQRLGTSCKF